MGWTVRQTRARQILDSRGNPTIEVEVRLADGSSGRAAVPSGASTGSHEAVELRDGGERWSGKGVAIAVGNVNGVIASSVVDREFADLASLDAALIELDGTPDKGRLGANAVLGVSLAVAHALALASARPLWQWISEQDVVAARMRPATGGPTLPVPMMNIVNGGEHANNSLDVQEFMVVPHGFARFGDALEAGVATFHALKGLLDRRGMSTAVGDEGGFAPDLASNEQALELLVEAIGAAGYRPGEQISIALDVAATELYRDGAYRFAGDGVNLDAGDLVDSYERWLDIAPLISIEDGMSEDDWDGWRLLTERLGESVQLVGDDLFVTNPDRLRRGIETHVANAMLVKVNQIGTLSETLAAMALGVEHGYRNVISHRSGETEDATIADIAVGTGCGQIKTGAPSRGERVAKYNQLLRIEEQLGGVASYAQPFAAAGARSAC